MNQYTGKTIFILSENLSKTFGVFWLAACILFVITALLFILNKEQWRVISLADIIISQALIVIYWPDAKAGTVANIIILMVSCLRSEISFQSSSKQTNTANFYF